MSYLEAAAAVATSVHYKHIRGLLLFYGVCNEREYIASFSNATREKGREMEGEEERAATLYTYHSETLRVRPNVLENCTQVPNSSTVFL